MQKLKLPLTLSVSHLQKPQEIDLPQCRCKPAPSNTSAIVSKLAVLAESSAAPFHPFFVRSYLLVKLNNIAAFGGQSFQHFLVHLTMFYNDLVNQPRNYVFKQGYGGKELISQILLQSGAYVYLTPEQIQEVLQANGVIAVTLAETYISTTSLLQKSEYVLSFGLTSLLARLNPFIPIVHQDKNHAGESRFAVNVFQKLQLNPQIEKPTQLIIQDAYSLRCTPQVHGVVYDILKQIEVIVNKALNKPQAKYITVKGSRMRNLMFREECETTLLDSLVCGLNQIGHMSFLRAERMLNKYLAKNGLSESPVYDLLMTKLKKVSLLVSHNRKLASPTNADTVILDNYAHDVFVDEFSPSKKTTQMISNLKQLLKCELSVATEALQSLHGDQPYVFCHSQMQKLFKDLVQSQRKGYQCLLQRIDKWLNDE